MHAVIVGAGIVGIGAAHEAIRQGMTVTLVEQDARPVGASVRNFGHCCTTPQAGAARRRALLARERWLELSGPLGIAVQEVGTLVVARAADELAVLEELAAERGGDEVRVLDPAGVEALVPALDRRLVGGAHLPKDLRIDPRTSVPRLLDALEARDSVQVLRRTSVRSVAGGVVTTSRGELRGDHVVVCVGHDLDRLLPGVTDPLGVRRCALHMLRATAHDHGRRIGPALLSGTSLLRYDAFSSQPSAALVQSRLEAEHPDWLAAGLHTMCTQLPDGDLLLGDTHAYEETTEPFQDEAWDVLVLREAAALLGLGTADLRVRERWQGVYASAAEPFLVRNVEPGLTALAVTAGIGMTTGLGFAAEVVAALASGDRPDDEGAPQ